MSLPNHGANPDQLAGALGLKLPELSIDFSVNTNPFGPPRLLMNESETDLLKVMANYPDPHVTQLTKLLAERNHVLTTQVLVGNGAAELIFLLASLFRDKKVRIIEPAFSEYRDACSAYGCRIESFILQEPWELKGETIKTIVSGVELLFLCSPNNPTGVRYPKATIVALLKEAEKANVHVVVDEAFYDFCEEQEGLEDLCHEFQNLIILRSLTKMYAIAGLRLGYMIADETVIRRLKALQPPWSVNGLAQKIGLSLLQDRSFVRDTVKKLHVERKWMKEKLEGLNFDISCSTVNFYLLSEKNKGDLHELFVYLLKRGIVARHTYNFNGLNGRYLRLAVKDRPSNEQLLLALMDWRRAR